MKDKNRRKNPKRARRDSQEIGMIRIFSNPGPDAEDRLGRLLSLMVRHATRDGQVTSENVSSPTDARHTGNHPEAEA